MTNLDSILKTRDITLPTKIHLVKPMIFPVVMYGCDNWTIKKAECWRTDVFVLWCWKRLLTVPWTARRSKQSILKEINPEYSLEGLMLRLKLQYFGHLMQRTDSLENIGKIGLRAEGKGDDRGWDGWMVSPTQWTWVWVNSKCWWWTGRPGMLQSMGSQGVRHDWANELNWSSVRGRQLLTLPLSPKHPLPSLTVQQLAILSFKPCPRVTPGEVGTTSSSLPAPKSKVTTLFHLPLQTCLVHCVTYLHSFLCHISLLAWWGQETCLIFFYIPSAKQNAWPNVTLHKSSLK